MNDIRAIRTEADYDWALAEVEGYFDEPPPRGSAEAERFDILAALIEGYESKHWDIEPADPVETIKYKMEIANYDQNDLATIVGSQSRASDILNRKRGLSLAMIRRLSRDWKIPADLLIRPYRLHRAA